MKNTKILKLIIFSLVLIIFSFNFCTAAGLSDFGKNLGTAAEKAGYDKAKKDIDPYISEIINIAISLVGIVFLGLMIYAGFLWMTAKGDEAQITKAKNIITASIIGMAIIMLAYVISMYLIVELGNDVIKSGS